jgi:parallel beta-helix repeat protein
MNRPSNIAIVTTLLAAAVGFIAAGPLTPPSGAVTSSYKTLGEVEPRIAINSTNTPGDNDATPSVYKITQPGSYYLTGNILTTGKIGIEIASSNITVDLNGFALNGLSGPASGISVTLASSRSVSVRNGTLMNWGQDGLDLGLSSGCIVENVMVSNCGGAGIKTGASSVVSRCSVATVGGAALSCGGISTISQCTARTADVGVSAGILSVMQGCSATECRLGISAKLGSSVTACVTRQNSEVGITASESCIVDRCVSEENFGDGLALGTGSTVLSSTFYFNGSGGDGAGINVYGSRCRVEGNNCSKGDRGIEVSGTNCVIIRNTCSANTVNWTIAAGNAYGPIIATPAGAAVNGNAAASALGSTDPNANFSY